MKDKNKRTIIILIIIIILLVILGIWVYQNRFLPNNDNKIYESKGDNTSSPEDNLNHTNQENNKVEEEPTKENNQESEQTPSKEENNNSKPSQNENKPTNNPSQNNNSSTNNNSSNNNNNNNNSSQNKPSEEESDTTVVKNLSYKESTSIYSWSEETLIKGSNELYSALEERNVRALYQSIEDNNMKKEYLADVITAYNERKIDVYRLIGEPKWTYDITRPKEKIDQIVAYNNTVSSSAKIAGVVIDIEPHALDEWEENSEELFRTFTYNMIDLYNYAKGKGLTVIVCTPVWFNKFTEHEELYSKAGDIFSLMNYTKSGNLTAIKEEVELAKKYNKQLETAAHIGSEGSEEITSYHNETLELLLSDHQKILERYNYDGLRASYHHFPTLEYLKNKTIYLQLKYTITDKSSKPTDMTLIDSNGKEYKGYALSLYGKQVFVIPNIKENTTYTIKSSTHVVDGNSKITIPEAPKRRLTLTINLKKG